LRPKLRIREGRSFALLKKMLPIAAGHAPYWRSSVLFATCMHQRGHLLSDHDSTSADLPRRIAQLEERVAQLERAAAAAAPEPAHTAERAGRTNDIRMQGPALRAFASPATRPPRERLSADRWFALGEGWLARAGVALLILGCIFLFRYAVDQGWLTPGLRLATGFLVAASLLIAGRLLIETRRLYAQILFGGGTVLLFVTTLAGVELYQLIPATVALLLHAAVVILAFSFAARRSAASIASVAAFGGFTGPALLLAGNVPGVAYWGYLALLAAACGTVYLMRGWPLFLGLAAGAAAVATLQEAAAPAARFAAVLATASAWGAFALAPLLAQLDGIRERLGLGHAHAHSLPQAALLFGPLAITAVLAAALTRSTGTQSALEIGWAVAAIVFAAAAVFSRRTGPAYDSACVLAAASTMAWALAALPWETAVVAIAIIALAAHVFAAALRAPTLVTLAHSAFALLAVAFLGSADGMASRPPGDALALGFLGATLAAAAMARVAGGQGRMFYAGGAFVAMHLLAALELGRLAMAPWMGSMAWAALGSGAIIMGLKTASLPTQRAGMISLAALVIRLFVVELATASVGLRILLFMGFGVLFIGLGYMFRAQKGGVQPAEGIPAA
jgi:hypothetical protein